MKIVMWKLAMEKGYHFALLAFVKTIPPLFFIVVFFTTTEFVTRHVRSAV